MFKKIVVVDAGGTKSAWAYRFSGWSGHHYAEGANPFHESDESIEALLDRQWALVPAFAKADLIVWYGAGCAGRVEQERIKRLIQKRAPEAEVRVRSDLLAVAHSSVHDEPKLIAILGTGSNAAFYDGERIAKQVVNLGYLLGDEGSGYDMGRSLVRAYFFGDCPDVVSKVLKPYFPEGRATLLDNCYGSGSPKTYLANFSRVAGSLRDEPFIQELVKDRFRVFVHTYLQPLNHNAQVVCTGSVAFHFQKELRTVLAEFGYKLESVFSEPMNGLRHRYQL